MADEYALNSIGDYLYRYGDDGEIFNVKKPISVTVTSNEVTLEYENYYIKIYADGDGDTRTNPRWERIKKE